VALSFIEIQDILNDYSEAVSEGIIGEVRDLAKEGKKEVSALSPRDTGKYAKGWTIKTTNQKGRIECKVWNKTGYRLTHLLERPHAKRNQYGSWGTTYPKSEGHISKVQNRINDEIMQRLEQVIKNGG